MPQAFIPFGMQSPYQPRLYNFGDKMLKECQKCKTTPDLEEPEGFIYLMWSGPYSGGTRYEFEVCQNCAFELGKKIYDAVEPVVHGLWRNMVSGDFELTAKIPGSSSEKELEWMLPNKNDRQQKNL